MKIESLFLKNIGPFLEAHLDFNGDNGNPVPVTIITGENGTGKSIILDAIRGVLLGIYGKIHRDISRNQDNFKLEGNFIFDNNNVKLISRKKWPNAKNLKIEETWRLPANRKLNDISASYGRPNLGEDIWITNYWTSKTSNEALEIKNLSALEPENYLTGSLDGEQSNIEVIKIITYFDYLKTSDNPKEKQEGEFLFNTLKKIIKLSLLDGEFKYVERKTLMPVVSQNGYEVSLEKLSSGNLYLIQRMVGLLGQMFAVYVLNNLSLKEMLSTPGLLLIDEAENHLHPKWQKTFLKSILAIFPNLQIVVTTHSPFIVSSVENAKVYVCKSIGDHSIIVDETDLYSNKPIEEILASPVFDTLSFNDTISNLMLKRKNAIERGDFEESHTIEEKLKQINPQYFSYFDVDKLLESITR